MDRRKIAGKHKQKRAADYYADIAPLLHEWSEQGIPQDEQAGMLNAMGKRTREGRFYSQVLVCRVLKRAVELGQIPQPTF